LLGYVDFRIAILQGALPDVTCLLGMMVQDTYDTLPAIRAALMNNKPKYIVSNRLMQVCYLVGSTRG